MERIDFERLVAFACGELDAGESARTQGSIARSPESVSTLARLRDVLTAFDAGALADPRPALMARLNAIGRAPEPAWSGLARRIIASLVFDTWAAPAAGLRGQRGPRQRVFESDAAEVDLATLPPEPGTGGRWRIRGQVTPRHDQSVAAVQLRQAASDTPVADAAPDADGQFVLSAERGVYDLAIRCGDTLVVVPSFEVG